MTPMKMHLVPDRGPAAALQERVADDLDVVAAPDEVGDPAQPDGNVLDGKHQAGEQEDEQESAERHRLHRGDLVGDGDADHGAEASDAEGVEDGGDEEGRGISGKAQAEVSEEKRRHDESLAERDHHEREDFAEQELVRGDAGDVDLQDRLLLAFLRHGERRRAAAGTSRCRARRFRGRKTSSRRGRG